MTTNHSFPEDAFATRLRKLTPDASGLDVTALAFEASGQ